MSRLPILGGDDNNWGVVLNDFLSVAHDPSSGALTTNAVKAAGGVTVTGSPSDGQILQYNAAGSAWVPATATGSGTVSDATSGGKGIIQLAGDLAGAGSSAAAPVITNGAITAAKIANTTITDAQISASAAIAQSKVSGLTAALSAKATDTAVVHNTGTETVAGAKTFSTGVVTAALQVTGGTPANGKVLTSDASGNASWVAPSAGGVQVANDIGGTTSAPTVVATHLSAALPINQGGTGSTTQNFIDLSSAQTVAGIKTFSASPIVPLTPSTSTQVASKGYVDTAISGVSGGSSLTVKDEGTTLTATPVSINFTGAGVTATNSSNAVTVTIPGGSGSGGYTAVSKSGAYTASSGDFVVGNSASAGFIITLPAAANGAYVRVKKLGADGNTISVVPPSGTIDGSASVSVNGQYASQDFMSDGTNWYQV